MTATTHDPLVGVTRGTVAEAIAYAEGRGAKRLPDVETYVAELWRLCAIAHLDATLLFGQAADETRTFTSPYWIRYGNPAGIGALETLDRPGDITYVGGTFTAATAAQAHVVHAYLYAVGPVPAGHPLAPFVPLDPRYDAVIAAGYAGRATSLAYLSGRWAANPNYAAQIVAHVNLAFSMTDRPTPTEATMPTTTKPKLNMTKGLIPYPPVRVELANKVENVGVNRLGKRLDRGDNWHRGLTGRSVFGNAVAWLNLPTTRGQTDYYIDHITGEMVRMLQFGFADDWTPWAQGPWSWTEASPDALAFMNLYEARRKIDVNVWNSDLKSIEIDGDDEWISPACKKTMIEYSAAHWHDLGVRHDQAPIGPDGITVMFSHREGCGVSYKKCAFSVVWEYINSDEFIGAVRDRMESYQTGKAVPLIEPSVGDKPVPVAYATLQRPHFVDRTDKAWVDAGGTRFLLVTDQYRAIRATPRLQYGYPDAPRVGPNLAPGEDAQINFVFEEGGEVYGLSAFGTRFLLKDFERVSDLPAKAA